MKFLDINLKVHSVHSYWVKFDIGVKLFSNSSAFTVKLELKKEIQIIFSSQSDYWMKTDYINLRCVHRSTDFTQLQRRRSWGRDPTSSSVVKISWSAEISHCFTISWWFVFCIFQKFKKTCLWQYFHNCFLVIFAYLNFKPWNVFSWTYCLMLFYNF